MLQVSCIYQTFNKVKNELKLLNNYQFNINNANFTAKNNNVFSF